jgi:hypothetical protein
MVEARLLGEVRSIARARRRRAFAAVLAMAAALFVAVALPMWRGTTQPVDSAAAPGTAQGEVATAFLPLFYSNVPARNAQIVRMKVPRGALASFGLATMDSLNGLSGGTVLADVLVGEDGLARAVRFVRPGAQRE